MHAAINALVELVRWGVAENSICLRGPARRKRKKTSGKLYPFSGRTGRRVMALQLLEIGLNCFASGSLISRSPADERFDVKICRSSDAQLKRPAFRSARCVRYYDADMIPVDLLNFECCARGRPIIVEWERDARHSAGLSLVRRRGCDVALPTRLRYKSLAVLKWAMSPLVSGPDIIGNKSLKQPRQQGKYVNPKENVQGISERRNVCLILLIVLQRKQWIAELVPALADRRTPLDLLKTPYIAA
ncbi:hypothetical protein EVAR_79095_1 [Eumeta japonica]|uniref:Uncharacterized protein n=1 Tax=Eumeta variegata TaxID=151549 RepID=A0A4C1X3K9_EUMVA|nr:hypothetical protein EVAR_79095_1 [Eumeta japonica]